MAWNRLLPRAEPGPTSALALCDTHHAIYITMEPSELRAWMDKRGWPSARALAPRLGVDPSTLTRWLSGESRLPEMVELALRGLEAEGRDRPD